MRGQEIHKCTNEPAEAAQIHQSAACLNKQKISLYRNAFSAHISVFFKLLCLKFNREVGINMVVTLHRFPDYRMCIFESLNSLKTRVKYN